jgi:hypothetical protein
MKILLFLVLLTSATDCHSRLGRLQALANMPSFNMLLTDSTTVLNAEEIPIGKPILLLYFRPDCPYSKQETKTLLEHIDLLKNARIYFISTAPLKDIKVFYQHFNLARFSNFTVGRDHYFSFYQAFRPSSVPYIAIYDCNKKLVKIYNEAADIDHILKAI